MSSLLIFYFGLLALAAGSFVRFSGSLAEKRAAIEDEAVAVATRKRVGRPASDPEKIWFRAAEKEVQAFDVRIDKTATLIVRPLLLTALANFILAPLCIIGLLRLLGALYFHFPAVYAALGLGDARSASMYGACGLLFEGLTRALTFEAGEAFHIGRQLYPASLDVLPVSALLWPLEVSTAAYFYFSLYEMANHYRGVMKWTKERNALAAELRTAAADSKISVLYEGLHKDRSPRFFSGATPPLLQGASLATLGRVTAKLEAPLP